MKGKGKVKILLVLILLWMGLSYEGGRNHVPQHQPAISPQNIQEAAFHYEQGLHGNLSTTPTYGPASFNPFEGPDFDDNQNPIPRSAYHGNWFARMGRGIGNQVQNLVREGLRQLGRAFTNITR